MLLRDVIARLDYNHLFRSKFCTFVSFSFGQNYQVTLHVAMQIHVVECVELVELITLNFNVSNVNDNIVSLI